MNMGTLRRICGLLRRYPPGELYYKVREKLTGPYRDYNRTKQHYWASEAELARQRAACRSLPKGQMPLISIVVPAYETPEGYLRQLVGSVCAQTYPRWELCIADGSSSDAVAHVIEEYRQETRIVYRRLPENTGISGNTNQGFAFSTGDYIALLDHDDVLMPNALYEMAKAVAETGAELLFSDEDKLVGASENYEMPHFKLDFNSELLLGNNYICHFLMFSRELLDRAGGMDSQYDGAQDFDFVLRCSELTSRIAHVPKILYHWRIHDGSTAGGGENKAYACQAGKRAVEAALRRRGQDGAVHLLRDIGFYRVEYPVPPHASLEIQPWGAPSRAWAKLQRRLGRDLHLAGVSVAWRAIPEPEPLFHRDSPMMGGSQEYVLRVNRAAVALTAESVLLLLGSCARPGVIAVSGKTIVGRRVHDCGYFLKNGSFQPRFRHLPARFKGYFRRAALAAEVDAVGNDLTMYHCNQAREAYGDKGGRILVEPAAQINRAKGSLRPGPRGK